MNRNTILSGNTRQYISVTEVDMLEQIEKLFPLYKSFNKLANDALRLGLPQLLKEKTASEITLKEEAQTLPQGLPLIVQTVSDERIEEIIRLLGECAVNSTITKFVACSLFNGKCKELNGDVIKAKNLQNGDLRSTPTYMEDYELEMLKNYDED